MLTPQVADSDIEKRYVRIDSGQVHVTGTRLTSIDAKKDSILLLHMTPLSSVEYENSIHWFAERFNVWAVDTPGFGGSDPILGDPTIQDYAHAILNVISELGLETVYIVGVHTGAAIAIRAALDKEGPGRISGIILTGSPCVTREEAREKLASKKVFKLGESGEHVVSAWNRSRRSHGFLPLERATKYLAAELSAHQDSYISAYNAVYEFDIEDAYRQLSEREFPTLHLYGDKDCIAWMQKRAGELFPSSKHIVIPGGSDFVSEEFPEEYVNAVLTFTREAVMTAEEKTL